MRLPDIGRLSPRGWLTSQLSERGHLLASEVVELLPGLVVPAGCALDPEPVSKEPDRCPAAAGDDGAGDDATEPARALGENDHADGVEVPDDADRTGHDEGQQLLEPCPLPSW